MPLILLWVTSLVFGVLWSLGVSTGIKQQVPVRAQLAQPSGHGAYSYSILMETDRFSQTDFVRSPAMLFEDGRALGPGNAVHMDIGEKGGGRFSFWKGILYFSSSDFSDPRTNGRHYLLSLPYVPESPWVIITCLFAGILTLWNMAILWTTLPRFRHVLVFAGMGVFLVITIGITFQTHSPLAAGIYSKVRTWIYIVSFDPARYERQGSDYCNPRFNPERIGKKHEEIDSNKDYDFPRLAQTRTYLWGVDRRAALKHIFEVITQEAQTNTEKHLAVLRFLQKASYHNSISPRDPSGIALYDPLVILELGEMWCDDVATLAIDLFSAAGYKARLVQLSTHQIAEIFYDGDWHFFDGDALSGGGVVVMPDGTIPSVVELSEDNRSTSLDSMPMYYESLIINSCYGEGGGSGEYGAAYYYSSFAYDEAGVQPGYFIKTAAPEEERQDPLHYGWSHNNFLPDPGRVIEPLPLHYWPSIVFIDKITVDPHERRVHLSFHSADRDNDLVGYRVYISGESRGWDYAAFYGSQKLEEYWANPSGWRPDMYEAFHRVPSSDVALLTTLSGELDISLPEDKTYYVSIMAYDTYGEQVGRKLFPASNEIILSLEK